MEKSGFLVAADLLPEPMMLVTLDGVIRGCNGSLADWLERPSESLTGTRFDSLVLEPASVVERYLRACAGSRELVRAALTVRRGREPTPCRFEGKANGPGSRGMDREVLLRLRSAEADADEATRGPGHPDAEGSLHRQRQVLEVTLASIGDAVIVTDAQGRVTFLNAVAAGLTGWPPEEACNRPLAEIFRIVNERTGRPVDNPVEKVLRTGAIMGLANHTVLRARDGREIPIDDSAAPIRFPDGELFGVVLIFRDISAQRRADHTRAWLAALIDSSDDAIVSKSLDGRITSWNAGAQRIFGHAPEEVIGRPITVIIPPELHEEEDRILARLRRGERVEHFETVRIRKDGRRIDVSLTISPILSGDGEIVGASKILRDITGRKEAERQLREANRRKDEFLATLAHELRNPLAPLRNAAALICTGGPPEPDVRTACEIIERQVRMMAHLVDDLLDVSRITAGHVRLQEEVLDVGEVLNAAVEGYRPAFDAADQTLAIAVPDEPVHVYGDRTRLMQVFSNILHNASKYTPRGGRISVALRREAYDAVASVRDTGIGIPAEMLRHVFDLFVQVDRSYERIGGGLGIGLTLARRLVEMHGGEHRGAQRGTEPRRLVEMHGGSIEARSEGPNRGSEFVVRLPATEVRSAEAAEKSPPATVHAPRRRILIADDNEDSAVSLGLLLQRMGHETRVVFDGLAAVEAAETFRPEVAILDIGMPKLDGYEAVRRIASRPWARSTLLVALTGWGQDMDRRRAKDAGFHRHLVKPADPEAIAGLLAEGGPPS